MTGIWTNSGGEWESGKPRAFEDEAKLHELIKENPQFLPLSGSPRLVVLGSEIRLGNGYTDILAVETSGRPAIIDVKLERNPEARKAIVSQIIAYAAFLQGFGIEDLEQGPLRRFLGDAGHASILDAVKAEDQEGAVDADSFRASLQDYLQRGSFRLVLVLDDVPAELERVVAYLDAITVQALTIDLITLKVYEVGGVQVALPQRVSPDLGAYQPSGGSRPAAPRGRLTDGSAAFRASIADTTGETREMFDTLIAQAEEWGALSNVCLSTYMGVKGENYTLLPRIMPDKAGLVTIWNNNQQPSVQVWRTMFERRAPRALESVERIIEPGRIGKGNHLKEEITPEILKALTRAYQEANGD
ncbi:MAG: hypothetical protein OXL41_08390 [Nitrospinae bacterium]|nr:hypothetical protein [Nitrospinota bacterium]